MTRLLPFIFVAGLVLEVVSIIVVSNLVGGLLTLLLLLAGGILGIGLFRTAGSSILVTLRSPVQDSSLQRGAAGEAMVRAISGLFLLIPGFFSDLIGLLLLLAPIRKWIRSKLQIRSSPASPGSRPHGGTIIEAEAIEIVTDVDPPARSQDHRSARP